MIGTQTDGNFFQPMAGLHGGFQFGGGGPTYSATDPDQWHHYCQTWDQASGARALYLDGVPLAAQSAAGAGSTFLDSSAYMVIGANTYPVKWLLDEYTTVNMAMTFDGEIDDLAVWEGVLTAADVAAVWERQGNEILGQVLPSTSSAIFLYTFDTPLVSGGYTYVENLGTASGADRDMVPGEPRTFCI